MIRRSSLLYILVLCQAVFLGEGRCLGLDRNNLAVVINVDDEYSRELGEYYKNTRNIPEHNIIRIRMGQAQDAISAPRFLRIAKEINRKTPVNIQAYALAWSRPFRVGCMSITSAVSLGYDEQYCATGCKPTKRVDYFDSPSRSPFTDHQIRPSMLIAASSVDEGKALILRGVESDFTRPRGKVFLMDTSDRHRNVRATGFSNIKSLFGFVLDIDIVDGNSIGSRNDVFMYFTGLKMVSGLERLSFLPGAVADHLTSTGGVLFGGRQMSVLRWIDSGATGSYGAVVEPCNFVQKFPDPGVLIRHYLAGGSLIEAYWKSVAMPGQGVFVGEPLAAPYKGCDLVYLKKERAAWIVNAPSFIPMKEIARCTAVSSAFL